jgi:hypothetical protein
VDISSILKSQIELIAVWCDIILFLLICLGVLKERRREEGVERRGNGYPFPLFGSFT